MEQPFETQPAENTLSSFITIWYKPRGTLRQILNTNPEKHVMVLAIIAGIQQVMDSMIENALGDSLSLIFIVLTAIIGGAIGGIISLYIGGRILYLAGGVLGGTGQVEHVRTAVAWSSVPDIIMLLIYALIILLFGHDWFTSSAAWIDTAGPLTIAFIFLLGFIGLILVIWKFFLLVKCLAEAQNISSWRSLASILLIVVPLVLVVVGCGFLAGR